MGRLVLPKHSSDVNDFVTVLKIYYENGSWVENNVFVEELKKIIGDGQYPSSYNKKAQLPKYFGFVTVDVHSNNTSRQKITALGKMLLEAIEEDNQSKINEAFMISFENVNFGRNNMGSPSSDSDIEMPNIALRAINDLQRISYKELAFILTEMDAGMSYDQAVREIEIARNQDVYEFNDPNRYADNKPIMLLVNLGILEIDEGYTSGRIRYYKLSDTFANQYKESISDLPLYNKKTEFFDNNLQNQENDRVSGGENVLFYGVPGSGKSHTIESKYGEDNMIRVVFHPDYMNTDFIGQILPTVKEDKTITYEFTPGPFTKIMKEAHNDRTNHYYLVIEEINRGNAPAIFGEIFQLLDRDENGTSKYSVVNYSVAREMYGDESIPVKIPSNLSVLATMNTSDQNVFALDTAFQRRWNMRMIKNDINKATHKDVKIADTSVTWGVFNTVINDHILASNSAMLSSEDKRLGGYFISPTDLQGTDIEKRFSEKVIKYLWDDAFKFSRDKLFNVQSLKSLEEVISEFLTKDGNERFSIFIDDIKRDLIEKSEGNTEASSSENAGEENHNE